MRIVQIIGISLVFLFIVPVLNLVFDWLIELWVLILISVLIFVFGWTIIYSIMMRKDI